MQLDHIAIWVNDLEKVKNFYQKYFICSVSNKYENPKKQFSSYFLSFSNGSRIELMKKNDLTNSSKTENLGLTHIAINVGTQEKVDTLTKLLEMDGYTIKGYPRITGDGYYESVILDPENNKVELSSIEDCAINIAKEEDLEHILYLQKCCYLSEAEIYDNYTIRPLTTSIEDIKKDFAKKIILKLEYKNKIIGSVRGYENQETGYIGKLIVNKDYQNMGFGKLLMDAIEQKFKNANRYELFTGFKSEKNLYLYKKLGYKEFKEEKVNGMIIKYLEKLVTY